MSTCVAVACVQGRKTKAQTNAQSRQKFRNARMDWTGRVDEEMLDVTYGFGTRIGSGETHTYRQYSMPTPRLSMTWRKKGYGLGGSRHAGRPRVWACPAVAYLIAAWRLALAVISARAASTPAQPSVFTHLPASRSL